MSTRSIGIIGFPGVMALDLVAPYDAFMNAGADGRRAYRVSILGLTRRAFTSESGITFKPDRALEDVPTLDTLIVPGGAGLRNPRVNARVVAWIKSRAPRIRRIARSAPESTAWRRPDCSMDGA